MIVFRMFYRVRIPLIIFLSLLLLAPASFASQLGAKRKELRRIDAQIKATRDKRSDAAQRQLQVRRQIQQSDRHMVEIQKKLNKSQAELNDVIGKKRGVEAKLHLAQDTLDEMQPRLSVAQKRLNLKRGLFNKRLIGSYKHGAQSAIGVLLSARSYGDFVTRVEFLQMIAEHEGRLVRDMKQLTSTIAGDIARIEAAKKASNRQRLYLVAEKRRVDKITRSVIVEQRQLEGEMRTQQRLYAQLQREQERLARTEGTLRNSSRKVAGQINALQRRSGPIARGTLRAGTPKELTSLAKAIAEKYGIPPKLFFALINQESGWDYRAVSGAGAIGLTQIMPFNVVAMGYRIGSFRSSPADQLEAGARYLSQQYQTFGRWDLALAAYNAGPGAVLSYGGIPPYRETRNYVRSILRMAEG